MAENDFNPAQKPCVYDLVGRLNGIFDRRVMTRLYRMSKELQTNASYHQTTVKKFGRYGRRRVQQPGDGASSKKQSPQRGKPPAPMQFAGSV